MSQDFEKPFTSPPTIFSVSLIVGLLIGFFVPIPLLPGATRFFLGPVLILLGVFCIVRSIKDIEGAGTTYDPYEQSTALVTVGVYRYSRNPGYLGLAIAQFGLAVVFNTAWVLVTGVIAIFVTTRFVIRLEERKLTDKFGVPYQQYQDKVRRWI